jgi:hypothetical protein
MLVQNRDKLLTDYPFRQGLAIYLGMWKRLGFSILKAFVGIGVAILLIQLVGGLALTTVAGIVWSFLSAILNVIITHPLSMLFAVVGLAAIYVVYRTVKQDDPTKW